MTTAQRVGLVIMVAVLFFTLIGTSDLPRDARILFSFLFGIGAGELLMKGK